MVFPIVTQIKWMLTSFYYFQWRKGHDMSRWHLDSIIYMPIPMSFLLRLLEGIWKQWIMILGTGSLLFISYHRRPMWVLMNFSLLQENFIIKRLAMICGICCAISPKIPFHIQAWSTRPWEMYKQCNLSAQPDSLHKAMNTSVSLYAPIS